MAGWKIQMDGITQLEGKLDRLQEKAQEVAALGLYEGAGVMADKVSQAVQGIATAKRRHKEPFPRLPTPEEKAVVAGAKHGVAKFRKTGVSVETSVGYQNSGYAALNGKAKPVPMIANAINSGTSFMQKQPFLRRAFSQGRSAAKAATENGIKSRLEELNLD